MKWSARHCGIGGPFQLSLIEVRDSLQVAHGKYKYFRKHGHRYRRKNLNNRILRSQQYKYEESETNILAITQREKDRSEWKRKTYAMDKPMNQSASIVQTST